MASHTYSRAMSCFWIAAGVILAIESATLAVQIVSRNTPSPPVAAALPPRVISPHADLQPALPEPAAVRVPAEPPMVFVPSAVAETGEAPITPTSHDGRPTPHPDGLIPIPAEVAKEAPQPLPDPIGRGREIFLTEWKPSVGGEHQSDGLGPLYNEVSCVACHFQGGTGGGGPAAKNIVLRAGDGAIRMIHRFGTSPKHEAWRAQMLALPKQPADILGKKRDAASSVEFTERNSPALFGVGLIDSIPDDVLRQVEVASKQLLSRLYPELDDQDMCGGSLTEANRRPGRFGWKGQTASLREFTLNACAAELGLKVPGKHQPLPSYTKCNHSPVLDLSAQECDALVDYLRQIPAPRQERSRNPRIQAVIDRGQALFADTGCTACHLPSVGKVAGIYSDLLVHDMGHELAGPGSIAGYGDFDSGDPGPTPVVHRLRCGNSLPRRASEFEWRTPPLWGCRDSAPYLHDGRAATLEQAIVLHGGQGRPSSLRFQALSKADREALLAFLNSLAAPPVRVVQATKAM